METYELTPSKILKKYYKFHCCFIAVGLHLCMFRASKFKPLLLLAFGSLDLHMSKVFWVCKMLFLSMTKYNHFVVVQIDYLIKIFGKSRFNTCYICYTLQWYFRKSVNTIRIKKSFKLVKWWCISVRLVIWCCSSAFFYYKLNTSLFKF